MTMRRLARMQRLGLLKLRFEEYEDEYLKFCEAVQERLRKRESDVARDAENECEHDIGLLADALRFDDILRSDHQQLLAKNLHVQMEDRGKLGQVVHELGELVVAGLQQSPLYLHDVRERLMKIYENDVRTLGLSRTCGVLSVVKDFCESRNDPIVLTTPSPYPADTLAKHVMQRAEVHRWTEMDGRSLHGVRLHSEVASVKDSETGIIVHSFGDARWSLQRGLYDACKDHRVPLVALVEAERGYDDASRLMLDHEFEIGVRSRFRFRSLPHLDYRIFCGEAKPPDLETTLKNVETWREGLLPFGELLLGRGEGKATGPSWTV